MKQNRKSALLYIRKSRVAKGVPDPASPEIQETACRQLAAKLGYTVDEGDVFRDAEGHSSGRSEKRPGLQALLLRAQAGDVGAVIVFKYNRLARKTSLLLQILADLKKAGVALQAVHTQFDVSTPQGYAMLTVNAAFDQMLADEVSDDRKRAIDMLRRKRGRHYGSTPFGAVRVEKDGDRVLAPSLRSQPNGTDNDAVTRLYQLYTRDRPTFADLAERMNQDGWRYRGRDGLLVEWTRDSARRVLSHHWIYAGYVTIGRRINQADSEIVPGSHGALIPPDLAAAVAAEWGRRFKHNRGKRRTPGVYPLTGLLTCVCGAALAGNWLGQARYYRHRQKCAAGLSMTIRADFVEAEVRERLANLPWPLEIEIGSSADALAMMALERRGGGEAERQRIQGQLERLKELYIDGEISKREYGTRKAALEAEMPDERAELTAPPVEGLKLPGVGESIRTATAGVLRDLAGSVYERIERVADGEYVYTPRDWCAEWA